MIYGSNPDGLEIFLFHKTSRLALVPTLPPVEWVLGVKQLGHKADLSSPSIASRLRMSGVIPPVLLYVFMVCTGHLCGGGNIPVPKILYVLQNDRTV
jgi:hypothetical protein